MKHPEPKPLHPKDLCIHTACAECGWRWSHTPGMACRWVLCWLCEREREAA
jgi:hypothetical protein